MTTAVQMLPNSDVIERMLLASMVLDAETLDACKDLLIADDFYLLERSELFALIAGLPRVDSTIVRAALEGHKRSLPLGDELTACMKQREWLKNDFNTEDYCAELRDRRICRELIAFGGHLAVEGPKGVPNGAAFISDAEVRLGKILSGRQDAAKRPEMLGELLASVCKGVASPKTAHGVRLCQTGIPDLDMAIGGFERGSFYVVAGRPGVGKSAFALQMAREISVEHKALVFSYEMQPMALATRMLSSLTGIDSRLIENRALNAKQLIDVNAASKAVAALDMPFFHPRTRSIEELRSIARSEHRKNGGKLGCILVDYLQLMEAKGRWGSKDQELGHISHALKALAMELDCAVIAAAAISRKPDERQNKRPIMSDMRECGSIEYDANVMIGLYRPDADPTAQCTDEERGTAEAIIMKQRNGATGVVRLRFVAQTTTFLQLHQRPQLRSV